MIRTIIVAAVALIIPVGEAHPADMDSAIYTEPVSYNYSRHEAPSVKRRVKPDVHAVDVDVQPPVKHKKKLQAAKTPPKKPEVYVAKPALPKAPKLVARMPEPPRPPAPHTLTVTKTLFCNLQGLCVDVNGDFSINTPFQVEDEEAKP